MRPKICVPIVEKVRGEIIGRAREFAILPVEIVEWRVDFYTGPEKELQDIIKELRQVLCEKELIVTLRTEAEGGEPDGSRFDYFSVIESVLQQGMADYVDIEAARSEDSIRRLCTRYAGGSTKIIGSYHDFEKTPAMEEIVERLQRAKTVGCAISKLACMPATREDVETLLNATAAMKQAAPDHPLITMSMGELGKISRLYGGLYGSEVSFGCVGKSSAPGQISYEQMMSVFDKAYQGNKHIILIGFMGVGKSTISKELAIRMNREEIDTDLWIEEHGGRGISQIFKEDGEEYFRELETAMIDELGEIRPAIVSCGGGMVLRELNVRTLQSMGNIVLLTAEPESIYERVRHSDNRPLLNGNMNVEYIRKMMERRRPYYERAANVVVSTDHKMISDIAKEILEKCF